MIVPPSCLFADQLAVEILLVGHVPVAHQPVLTIVDPGHTGSLVRLLKPVPVGIVAIAAGGRDPTNFTGDLAEPPAGVVGERVVSLLDWAFTIQGHAIGAIQAPGHKEKRLLVEKKFLATEAAHGIVGAMAGDPAQPRVGDISHGVAGQFEVSGL